MLWSSESGPSSDSSSDSSDTVLVNKIDTRSRYSSFEYIVRSRPSEVVQGHSIAKAVPSLVQPRCISLGTAEVHSTAKADRKERLAFPIDTTQSASSSVRKPLTSLQRIARGPSQRPLVRCIHTTCIDVSDTQVRTSDNVELVLEGIIFWKIDDVEKMIETTADPQGDVWYHSRSSLNQAVSASTLEEFMSGFNTVTSATLDHDFYAARGITLHTLEVTRYSCRDPDQEKVLQEIIAETTNRINDLQRQKSLNDVESEKLAAEVLLEVAKLQLVEAEAANERAKLLAEQAVEIELLQNNMTALIGLETSRTQLVEKQALLHCMHTGEERGKWKVEGGNVPCKPHCGLPRVLYALFSGHFPDLTFAIVIQLYGRT